jgi:hypothetical protein
MMQHLLATWQNLGIGAGMLFAILVVMQRAFDRYAGISPISKLDFTRHYDRKPRELPAPKDLTTYDPVAQVQLRKIEERRRRQVPDSGHRRRRTDHEQA